MVDKDNNKGEQSLRYNLFLWNKIVSFGILYHISEHVTLV